MQAGEMLTRSLAQLAVACYLLRVLADIGGLTSPRIACWKRRIWTLGCAALWLHVAAAFQFIHHWSQAEALRQTAEQTQNLTGWSWGGGIYINYVFAAFWLWTVIRWRRLAPASQSSAEFWTLHAIFAFMMFNATVVFGPLYWRFISVGFAGLAITTWIIRRRVST